MNFWGRHRWRRSRFVTFRDSRRAEAYLARPEGQAAGLGRPLPMHFAELDAHVPLDTVERVREALADRPETEIHLYSGADHGFNRFGQPPHHEASAELALARSLGFLGTHLG